MVVTGNSVNWMFAILASVVLHAVVIGLATATSSPKVPPTTETCEEVKDEDEVPESPEVENAANMKTSPKPNGNAQSGIGSIGVGNAPAPVTRPKPVQAIPMPERAFPEVYEVKRGDTLTKIAKIYGLTVEEIAAANGKSVKKMNILWVGQKVKLR